MVCVCKPHYAWKKESDMRLVSCGNSDVNLSIVVYIVWNTLCLHRMGRALLAAILATLLPDEVKPNVVVNMVSVTKHR